MTRGCHPCGARSGKVPKRKKDRVIIETPAYTIEFDMGAREEPALSERLK